MNTNDQIILGDWMWEKTQNGDWSRWWRLPRTCEFTYDGLSESAEIRLLNEVVRLRELAKQ